MKPIGNFVAQPNIKLIQFSGVSPNDDFMNITPSNFYTAKLKGSECINVEKMTEQQERKMQFELSDKFTPAKEIEQINVAREELIKLLNMTNQKDIEFILESIDKSLSLQSLEAEINTLKKTGTKSSNF